MDSTMFKKHVPRNHINIIIAIRINRGRLRANGRDTHSGLHCHFITTKIISRLWLPRIHRPNKNSTIPLWAITTQPKPCTNILFKLHVLQTTKETSIGLIFRQTLVSESQISMIIYSKGNNSTPIFPINYHYYYIPIFQFITTHSWQNTKSSRLVNLSIASI